MTAARTIISALSLIILTTQAGWALDEEIAQHPDRALAAAYQANEKEVEALRSRISTAGDEKDRLSAFTELAQRYPLAAEITARGHVTDKNGQVALTAIQILKGATVMSDHVTPHGDKALLPRVAYMMKKHKRSRAALRPAVSDKRKHVRQEAAGFLASLSDRMALEIIANDENDLYSDVEAANLYTLASGGIGQKYLERYIGNGDIDAQRTAVNYLGAISAYQPAIRVKYFLNPDAPTAIRTDAARTLSTYDPEFPGYALVVTSDSDIDPALFEATLSGYVDIQIERGQFDPQSARLFSNQVRRLSNSEVVRSDAVLRNNIKALSQRLDAFI